MYIYSFHQFCSLREPTTVAKDSDPLFLLLLLFSYMALPYSPSKPGTHYVSVRLAPAS